MAKIAIFLVVCFFWYFTYQNYQLEKDLSYLDTTCDLRIEKLKQDMDKNEKTRQAVDKLILDMMKRLHNYD